MSQNGEYDRDKAINDAVYEVVDSIIYHCTYVADDSVSCIKQHVERLGSEPLIFYMTRETYEAYRTLSDEDHDRIVSIAREKLLTYAEGLCETYRQLEAREEGDSCSSL